MKRRHLFAAALLLAAAPPLPAQSVKAGIEAWQRSDYAGAVAIWRPLAEQGDADAQFNLGQAYRLGRGVPTSLSAAQTWFERAANQGHIDAQTTLGLLLFQNGDQATGIKWLKQAAEKGDPRAQLVYGTALVNGDGVTQNPILGYSYVSRAAAQGLQPAKDTQAQLDQLLPAADRKKALAMARTKPKAPPAAKPRKPAALAAAKPEPKPETTEAEAAGSTEKTAEAPAKPAAKPRKRAQVAEAKPEPKPKPAEEATETPAKPAAEAPPKKPAKKVAEKATPAERPAAKAASGNWRIQLGAFSQRASAQALYNKLSGKATLAGRHASYIAAGSITRLQVGPFESKEAAQAACRAVGVACFPVPAK